MTADLVTDALEMAIVSRGLQLLHGVIAHSDAGSQQYVSVIYTERLAEIQACPRSAASAIPMTVMAESVNGLCKTELAAEAHAEHVEPGREPTSTGQQLPTSQRARRHPTRRIREALLRSNPDRTSDPNTNPDLMQKTGRYILDDRGVTVEGEFEQGTAAPRQSSHLSAIGATV